MTSLQAPAPVPPPQSLSVTRYLIPHTALPHEQPAQVGFRAWRGSPGMQFSREDIS